MTNPRVLIVEDDKVIAYIEEWRLTKMGYDVCGSAGTGAEAMAMAAKTRPDIVLMDIYLEGDFDGIETAARIKKELNIPVIFVSGHIDAETICRARAINPDGFLRKPFVDDDLRIALEMGLKK